MKNNFTRDRIVKGLTENYPVTLDGRAFEKEMYHLVPTGGLVVLASDVASRIGIADMVLEMYPEPGKKADLCVYGYTKDGGRTYLVDIYEICSCMSGSNDALWRLAQYGADHYFHGLGDSSKMIEVKEGRYLPVTLDMSDGFGQFVHTARYMNASHIMEEDIPFHVNGYTYSITLNNLLESNEKRIKESVEDYKRKKFKAIK